MSVIKWKAPDKWESLYDKYFRDILRRSLNLGDINDRAEARKNLEIIGNNNHTHYHDDRYLPYIGSLYEALFLEIEARTAAYNKAVNEIARLEAELKSAKSDGSGTSMPENANSTEATVTRIFYDSGIMNSGIIRLEKDPAQFDEILVITCWDTGQLKIFSSSSQIASSFAEYRDKKWIQVYNYDRVVICMRKEAASSTNLDYSVGSFMLDANANIVPLLGNFGVKAIYGLSYS